MSLSSDNQWSPFQMKRAMRSRSGCYDNSEAGPSFQSMPEPTGAPWAAQRLPWTAVPNPGLVHFTAQPLQSLQSSSLIQPPQILQPPQLLQSPQPLQPAQAHLRNKQLNSLHCKRKSNVEVPIPAKQLITDEKMAAHFGSLHISCEYPSNELSDDDSAAYSMSEDSTSVTEMDVVSDRLAGESSLSFEERIKNAQRLTLCEEMTRIKNEPILPQCLLQRLEKPCMSLVLWKPPRKHFLDPTGDSYSNPDQENQHSSYPHRRTGVLFPECNIMDVEM